MTNQDFIMQLPGVTNTCHYFAIQELNREGMGLIERLPYSIRILVENLLRKLDGRIVTEKDLRAITGWQKTYAAPVEIPFHPARVLMQDFTGVPAVVDLAVMRDAFKQLGGDPARVNPQVPVELVAGHIGVQPQAVITGFQVGSLHIHGADQRTVFLRDAAQGKRAACLPGGKGVQLIAISEGGFPGLPGGFGRKK